MRILKLLFKFIFPDKTEWHECRFKYHIMQRKINGVWQYRPMTNEEEYDRFKSEAW